MTTGKVDTYVPRNRVKLNPHPLCPCLTVSLVWSVGCSWILDAMFATLTNVNFSPARISELIHESQALKMDLR
jgi:hypothetical protein